MNKPLMTGAGSGSFIKKADNKCCGCTGNISQNVFFNTDEEGNIISISIGGDTYTYQNGESCVNCIDTINTDTDGNITEIIIGDTTYTISQGCCPMTPVGLPASCFVDPANPTEVELAICLNNIDCSTLTIGTLITQGGNSNNPQYVWSIQEGEEGCEIVKIESPNGASLFYDSDNPTDTLPNCGTGYEVYFNPVTGNTYYCDGTDWTLASSCCPDNTVELDTTGCTFVDADNPTEAELLACINSVDCTTLPTGTKVWTGGTKENPDYIWEVGNDGTSCYWMEIESPAKSCPLNRCPDVDLSDFGLSSSSSETQIQEVIQQYLLDNSDCGIGTKFLINDLTQRICCDYIVELEGSVTGTINDIRIGFTTYLASDYAGSYPFTVVGVRNFMDDIGYERNLASMSFGFDDDGNRITRVTVTCGKGETLRWITVNGTPHQFELDGCTYVQKAWEVTANCSANQVDTDSITSNGTEATITINGDEITVPLQDTNENWIPVCATKADGTKVNLFKDLTLPTNNFYNLDETLYPIQTEIVSHVGGHCPAISNGDGTVTIDGVIVCESPCESSTASYDTDGNLVITNSDGTPYTQNNSEDSAWRIGDSGITAISDPIQNDPNADAKRNGTTTIADAAGVVRVQDEPNDITKPTLYVRGKGTNCSTTAMLVEDDLGERNLIVYDNAVLDYHSHFYNAVKELGMGDTGASSFMTFPKGGAYRENLQNKRGAILIKMPNALMNSASYDSNHYIGITVNIFYNVATIPMQKCILEITPRKFQNAHGVSAEYVTSGDFMGAGNSVTNTIKLVTDGTDYYVQIGEVTDEWLQQSVIDDVSNSRNLQVQVSQISGRYIDTCTETSVFRIEDQTPYTILAENFLTIYPRWHTARRPLSPYIGLRGYNTALQIIEEWDGSSWVSLGTY